MATIKPMVGEVFGPWTVVEQAPRPDGAKTQGAFWLCRCSCGNTETINGARLRAGRMKRGCFICSGRTQIDGTSTPTYNTWRGMRERCLRPDHVSYRYYGGAGIKVCDRWRDSFAAFLADMGGRPAAMTLDRIDPNGDYTPENCRWADAKTQSRNTSHFRLTDEQVEAARRALAAGATQQDIAILAGVARSHIANIATGHARSPHRKRMEAAQR